jgi:hypothetical protein
VVDPCRPGRQRVRHRRRPPIAPARSRPPVAASLPAGARVHYPTPPSAHLRHCRPSRPSNSPPTPAITCHPATPRPTTCRARHLPRLRLAGATLRSGFGARRGLSPSLSPLATPTPLARHWPRTRAFTRPLAATLGLGFAAPRGLSRPLPPPPQRYMYRPGARKAPWRESCTVQRPPEAGACTGIARQVTTRRDLCTDPDSLSRLTPAPGSCPKNLGCASPIRR